MEVAGRQNCLLRERKKRLLSLPLLPAACPGWLECKWRELAGGRCVFKGNFPSLCVMPERGQPAAPAAPIHQANGYSRRGATVAQPSPAATLQICAPQRRAEGWVLGELKTALALAPCSKGERRNAEGRENTKQSNVPSIHLKLTKVTGERKLISKRLTYQS